MKVLIVDDDRDMRDAISDVLEIEGFSTGTASDGQEALDYLRNDHGVCAILLDLMMPRMNGWEFRKAQSEDPRIASIPVIIITADGNAAEKATRLAADDFLQKPMPPERLVSMVSKYCG